MFLNYLIGLHLTTLVLCHKKTSYRNEVRREITQDPDDGNGALPVAPATPVNEPNVCLYTHPNDTPNYFAMTDETGWVTQYIVHR